MSNSSSCCVQCCCPCLTTSNGFKYAYVRYKRSKSFSQPKLNVSSLTDPPQTVKMFEFRQEKNDYPQMFLETEKVISDQPKPQLKYRHSISSVGSEYLQYVSTGKASTLPRCDTFDRARSESLPLISRKKSYLRRTNTEIFTSTESIPGLPILEEITQSCDSEVTYPFLQFSLHYDVQRYILNIHLHNASNLPAMDRRGTSDPFVVLYLMPNKEEIFESKVVYKSLNPVFDQSFEFKSLMPDDIQQQTLVLRVYDHDKYSKNDTIGGVVLPLKDVDLFGVVMRMKVEERHEIFDSVSGRSNKGYVSDLIVL